jgi:excinuclease UvrABC ATPase subunit
MQAKTESTLLIIDEPTRGLHEYDVKLLMIALKKIVEKGTTIILTEHHKELIKQADWVIDIGPHAAEDGGQLLYEGPSEGLLKCKSSLTAQYLSQR